MTSGGRASRQKGDRFEREIVRRLNELGVDAHRVPLSGSAGGAYADDLRVNVCGEVKNVECKVRKRAWSDLFGWLQKGPFALIIKADRTEPLVVLRLEDFARLSKGIL